MDDIRIPVDTAYGDWNTRFGEIWKTQAAKLREKFGDSIEEIKMPGESATDMPIVYVKKARVIELIKFLKEDSAFDYAFFSDLTATDEQPDEPRFEMVYHLYSMTQHTRIRIKTRIREGEECPTLVGVWEAANWAEREVWDMFGIKFTGHPDLRRILMDERWVGHPLRKDYPIRGYQIFPTPQEIDPSLLSD